VQKRSFVADSPDSGMMYQHKVGLASHIRNGNFGEVCLVHLPLTIWIPGLLAPVALPAFVKGAFVLAVTVRLTLWAYDRFVRSTAVGALLRGRAPRRAARPERLAPLGGLVSTVIGPRLTRRRGIPAAADAVLNHRVEGAGSCAALPRQP
jgi:hypothetical protein